MGLGQDSTAIAILSAEGRLPAWYYQFRTYFVFADTGAELPETYAWCDQHFVPWLQRHGIELHVLKPHGPFHQTRAGRSYPDIRTAFMTLGTHPTFPTLTSPRCTMNSKQYPLARFREAKRLEWCGRTAYQQARNETPDVVLVGIAADEQHRALPSPAKNYVIRYPLIELGLARKDCQAIIKAAGLPVPPKSGCYLCPFAPAWHYWWLANKHPHLMAKVEEMEDACVEDRVSRGLQPNYILHSWQLPVRQAAEKWHRQNPRVTVQEIEHWMITKPGYAVHFGCKKADDRQLTFALTELLAS